jgi:hypothetical protein
VDGTNFDRVREAGWNDAEILEGVVVTSPYACSNRFSAAIGLVADFWSLFAFPDAAFNGVSRTSLELPDWTAQELSDLSLLMYILRLLSSEKQLELTDLRGIGRAQNP